MAWVEAALFFQRYCDKTQEIGNFCIQAVTGTSGHDFLINVDFQGKNGEDIDQTVCRVSEEMWR